MGTPAAEVEIDELLIERLLAEQVPELAGRPIRFVGHGWDNVTVRIGTDHAARLPRRAVAVPLIEHEQRWLPELAARLDVPIPVAVRCGMPSDAYPWPWSIVPWIEGVPADRASLHPAEAERLAELLDRLHTVAPADAPANPLRGVPLVERDEGMRRRLAEIGARRPDLAALCSRAAELWARGLAAPGHSRDVWLHGDLHARNLLVRNGRIAGLIDWGDVTSGDPATDLAALWALFDPPHHERFWRIYRPTDPGLADRAVAWAVAFGAMLLATGLDDDPHSVRSAIRTLERLTAQ